MASSRSNRVPVGGEAAESLRAMADQERRRGEELAVFLEDVAENGLPAPETCVPWETLRDCRLAALIGNTERPRL